MPYSPRNIRIACNHAGLTHYGGVYFFHEFLRVLRFRHFLATHLTYPRRNSRYHLSQMILALMYPIVLGLDRLETASFLRSNGTFQYLTGLPSFAESARGISPRAAHRSGLESLDSSGSCHPVKAAAFRRNQRVPPVAR